MSLALTRQLRRLRRAVLQLGLPQNLRYLVHAAFAVARY